MLIVLLLMFLFSAIAFGAVVVVRIETAVSQRFREATEARYAAEAGLAFAVAELRTIPDWTPVLRGAVQSAFSDGAFQGSKNLARGGEVLLCCGAGSVAHRLSTESAASPVPARRALAWQPFLWSTPDALVPQPFPTGLFLVVSLQDDEEDGDGDGGTDVNGVVVVRAEAVEPGGVHRSVEAVVERKVVGPPAGVSAVGLLRWREVR